MLSVKIINLKKWVLPLVYDTHRLIFCFSLSVPFAPLLNVCMHLKASPLISYQSRTYPDSTDILYFYRIICKPVTSPKLAIPKWLRVRVFLLCRGDCRK
jgi:hypothetical protein